MQSLCVYCGSSLGVRPEYAQAAGRVGRLLAQSSLRLVYGGAQIGLMGVVANAALAAGGTVVGVIPQALAGKEIAHTGLSTLHVVGSLHERKALMAELSDGFIALPGGFGTFEEFCEVLTWAQLGMHPKPCGLLNVLGYYDPLLALFKGAAAEGFVRPQHRALVLAEDDPARLLARMQAHQAVTGRKWADAEGA